MTKEDIIKDVTNEITEAPENAKKIQIIFLGEGGWIEAKSWTVDDE